MSIRTSFALGRTALAFALGVLALAATALVSPTEAAAETRTLNLYYTHTKQSAKITFKKNGRYLKSGLSEANKFLADWRTKEQIKMDPRLLDTVWEVYKKTGSRNPIHVVSSYRSPKTNAMLRKTRGGQAKKSQHMVGRALDFYIPGQSAKKMRALGLQAQSGGVGYYPKSGFVHLDTGRVRHWPRMSRSQLVKVFPKGGTLHVPSDGKALPGYKTAQADYKRRMASGGATALGVRGGGGGGGRGNILTALFGGGKGGDDAAPAAEPQRIAQLPRRGPQAGARPGRPAAVAASAPSAPVIRTLDPSQVAPLPGVDVPSATVEGTQEIIEEVVEEIVVASLPDLPPVPEFRPGPAGTLTPTAETVIEDAAGAPVAIADAIAAPAVPVIRPADAVAVAVASAAPTPVLAYRELPEVAPTVRALATIDRGRAFNDPAADAPAPSASPARAASEGPARASTGPATPGEGTSGLPSIVMPDDGEHPELTENALRLAFARSATRVAARRGDLVRRLETAPAVRRGVAVVPAAATSLTPARPRVADIAPAKIDALAEALRRQAAGVR